MAAAVEVVLGVQLEVPPEDQEPGRCSVDPCLDRQKHYIFKTIVLIRTIISLKKILKRTDCVCMKSSVSRRASQ